MQLLNQKVICKQLEILLDHVAQQINNAADPWLKDLRFDHHLFRCAHPKLSAYLSDCHQSLARLQRPSINHVQFQWQVELLVEQCQALLKTTSALTRPNSPAAISRSEELQGYEQRLNDIVRRLELRLQHTDSLQEQQSLLLELEKTQQRLVRCHAAQKAHYWQDIVS